MGHKERMSWCNSCPNRNLALLAEAVGAEDVARQIEATGCPWWQIQPRGDGTSYKEVCAAEEFDNHMRRYGGWLKIAVDTVQEDRNEQDRALKKVQAAVEEHGGRAVLQALGQLGLRTAIGHAMLEAPEDEEDQS